MAYEGDDPTLQALQEQVEAIEEVGFIHGGGPAEAPEEEVESGAPAKSASRGEWDEYALSQGLDPDDYATKEDLIEALS